MEKDVMCTFRTRYSDIKAGQVFFYSDGPYIRINKNSAGSDNYWGAVQLYTGNFITIQPYEYVGLPNKFQATFENTGDDKYGY